MRLPSRVFAPAAVLFLACAVTAADAPVADDWAYKRPAKAVVPPVAVGNPIDAFLLKELAKQKLAFAPPADKRTLLRRVYFDLIGLPPSPDDIAAFLKDESPTAFETVVDRLLASPQYGERQALMWLDLVRFAETDGFKADDTRPNAWRFRDYVIDSFNADKPYDRFIKEQLAGDELYPGDPAALVATGFLRHFPDEYNAVNLEQRRQEILNDITDTTAAAFLGVTLACARCHDHKTDPIAQHDYYRIQAFFAGYKTTDVPLASKEEMTEYEKKRAAWEAKTAEVRAEIEKVEGPYRDKDAKKARSRFDEEYAKLLDIPPEKRTPLQQQLAALIEPQVVSKGDVTSKMKAPEKERMGELKKKLADYAKDKPADPPRAMVMTDVGMVSPPVRLLKRGDWRKPSEELAPGFLSAFDTRDAEVKPIGNSPGRRAAFAAWVTQPDHPLTARVMANRIWQQHFGKGIVATSSDFGVTGDRPTHPDLLNWLAAEFVKNKWSVKHLHRLIVTSAAYRQGSRGDAAGANADPDNALLWQFPRRRLDGESLRDAMLATAGLLNPKAGGPSVFPEVPVELKAGASWKVSENPADRHRRSIYVFVKRNLRYPLFALFDAPDRNETCSRRFVTTTAPQALTLLNDAIVLGFAKTFADRVLKDSGTDAGKAIDRAFTLALGRLPDSEERAAALAFVKGHKGALPDAVGDLCHALLNLNEFLYVD
jgi:hypothetical protein